MGSISCPSCHIVLVEVDIFVSTPIIGPDDPFRPYARFSLVTGIRTYNFLLLDVHVISINVPVAIPAVLPNNDSVLDVWIDMIRFAPGYLNLLLVFMS